MPAEGLRSVAIGDRDLSMLSEYILYGWPTRTTEVQKHLQLFWSLGDGIVITDRINTKGKRSVIPASLQAFSLHCKLQQQVPSDKSNGGFSADNVIETC